MMLRVVSCLLPAMLLWMLCAAGIAAAQAFSAARPYAGVVVQSWEDLTYYYDFWTGITLIDEVIPDFSTIPYWTIEATSPDGRFMAGFGWTQAGQGVLHVVELPAQTVRCQHEPFPENVLWMSDSIHVLYHTITEDVTVQLWLVNVDTCTGQALLSDFPYRYISGLEWSPDEQSLIFTGGDWDSGEMYVYTLTLSDRTLRQLTTSAARFDLPHWSPDGSLLGAVQEDRDPVTFERLSFLLLMDLRGKVLHRLRFCDGCVVDWGWR